MRNIYTIVLATLLSLLAPSTTIAQIDWRTTPIPEYINQVNATATVRKAPAGNIIIAGKGDSLRAFSSWSGGGGRDTLYAQVANLYAGMACGDCRDWNLHQCRNLCRFS